MYSLLVSQEEPEPFERREYTSLVFLLLVDFTISYTWKISPSVQSTEGQPDFILSYMLQK